MSKIIGIDISTFQGVLDWNKVKAAGIKFAILRAGYGRYAVDDCFAANAKATNAAGIPIGAYWFSYALDAAAAKEEAKKCLETIKPYNITLPVFFDFEYDTVSYAQKQGVTLGRQAFNDHTVAFCDTILAGGYKAGVYYNLDYYNRFVDKSRLQKYVQWFAQYNSEPQISDYAIWQYTSTGSISGISGRFDMNELKDTSLLNGSGKYKAGWHQDSKGWWYAKDSNTYAKSEWLKISGKWYYFDEGGYMVANQWKYSNGNCYYLGADGAMVTDKTLKIDESGKLVPAGNFYVKLGDVKYDVYRETLDAAVKAGVLKGSGGSGDDMIVNLPEESVRMLVFMHRTGMF